jgi:hypothetical protein
MNCFLLVCFFRSYIYFLRQINIMQYTVYVLYVVQYMIAEGVMAVSTKTRILECNAVYSSSLNKYQHRVETCCLHLQGKGKVHPTICHA